MLSTSSARALQGHPDSSDRWHEKGVPFGDDKVWLGLLFSATVDLKVAYLNPSEYAESRNFWIGEFSKHNTCEGRKEIRSNLFQISNAVSDNGIDNCNRLFWLKHDSLKTVKLWELGKQIGVTLEGDEKKLFGQARRTRSQRQKSKA
ncbi:hypothetical protein VNO80_20005 [Phaseolus coccineus]|uniref:Uncharacterized protein n=1 Tax=Phaseolus coccineus TaxID=3886 RepID=A0AAN9MGP9_PHACN